MTSVVVLPPRSSVPPLRLSSWCSRCRRLLGVELDDELLLNRRVDDLPLREAVHENAHLGGENFDPRRRRAGSGELASDDVGRQVPDRLADLDDVVGADAVGRDVDLLAVDEHVPVPDGLPGTVPRRGEPGAVDDVVEPRLEDAQQLLAGLAGAAVRLVVVAAELLLEDAVDARALLLLALLQQVLTVLGATAAVLTRRVGTDLDGALRRLALAALEEQLHLLAPAALAVGTGVTGHSLWFPRNFSAGQTRRRLGGRQPLCGTGVTSWMAPTSRPVACRLRIAVSRPEPGPLTKTSTLRMPCSIALRAAFSAAICAANGVDLREPLKPTCPALAQEITAPLGSQIDTIVLLNVLLMCACPCAMFFFSLRRTFLAPAPARFCGGM